MVFLDVMGYGFQYVEKTRTSGNAQERGRFLLG